MSTFEEELLNSQLPAKAPASGVTINSNNTDGFGGYLISNWVTYPLNPPLTTPTPSTTPDSNDSNIEVADKLLRLISKLKPYFE
jgi:hypothetical protein